VTNLTPYHSMTPIAKILLAVAAWLIENKLAYYLFVEEV